HRRHAGVVHAASGTIPARVSRAATEALPPRALSQTRARRPSHLAAGRAARRGCRDPVRGHPVAVRAARAGARVPGGRGSPAPAGRYLAAQAHAGARAVQLFDSWVGCLSPADYATYVFPHSQRALQLASDADVPVIHFGTDTRPCWRTSHGRGAT